MCPFSPNCAYVVVHETKWPHRADNVVRSAIADAQSQRLRRDRPTAMSPRLRYEQMRSQTIYERTRGGQVTAFIIPRKTTEDMTKWRNISVKCSRRKRRRTAWMAWIKWRFVLSRDVNAWPRRIFYNLFCYWSVRKNLWQKVEHILTRNTMS